MPLLKIESCEKITSEDRAPSVSIKLEVSLEAMLDEQKRHGDYGVAIKMGDELLDAIVELLSAG